MSARHHCSHSHTLFSFLTLRLHIHILVQYLITNPPTSQLIIHYPTTYLISTFTTPYDFRLSRVFHSFGHQAQYLAQQAHILYATPLQSNPLVFLFLCNAPKCAHPIICIEHKSASANKRSDLSESGLFWVWSMWSDSQNWTLAPELTFCNMNSLIVLKLPDISWIRHFPLWWCVQPLLRNHARFRSCATYWSKSLDL